MSRATLTATERIKNSTEITTLIQTGRAFFVAPYKVYYAWADKNQPSVRAAFAIPIKKFCKAVTRNKLKRLSRECFRLQRHELEPLCLKKDKQLNLLFLYQKTAILSYPELYKAIGKAIEQINTNG